MTGEEGDIITRQAAAYMRGRPDYPAALEGWLRTDLGLGAGKVVLDLGSGTGKLLPRLKATGARVIAVEPLAQMRAHLVAAHPDVEARQGRAQAIPLADASVDAVTCAQCYHLFATGEARAEIARVLKPGGALGLVWNVRDVSAAWVAGIVGMMAPYDDGPPFEHPAWREAHTVAPDGFSPFTARCFANPHTGSPNNVIIDRFLSVSCIARLPQADRGALIARLHALIAATPELAGKPQVTFPNLTYAYGSRKPA
jgi:SAM-dependent methyltransferase